MGRILLISLLKILKNDHNKSRFGGTTMKTVEQAAREYTSWIREDPESVFKAGVEFAQRWIPVKDLPKGWNGKEILVKGFLYVNSRETTVGIGKAWGPNISSDFHKVISWRPIDLS